VLDLGRKLDDKVWKDMIQQVDLNQDGEVSFPEFEKIMEKLFENNY